MREEVEREPKKNEEGKVEDCNESKPICSSPAASRARSSTSTDRVRRQTAEGPQDPADRQRLPARHPAKRR